MFSPHSGFLGLQAINIPHGCETVLVRIQSDIFRSIDDNHCVLLQLPLDLSASINDILSIILSNFERVSSRFNISCLVPTIRFFDCMRCPSPSKVQVWTSALLLPHVTHWKQYWRALTVLLFLPQLITPLYSHLSLI